MNTRLTDVQKQVLRDDAIRAGGGKWRYVRLSVHSQGYITDEKGSTVINCTAGDVPANCASFLESAHPAAVLLLLDELVAKDAEIQEYRKAVNLELKSANLINKFYERYPLAEFKSDSERAEALGYFMAGAELQCYGAFIAYEGGNGDE